MPMYVCIYFIFVCISGTESPFSGMIHRRVAIPQFIPSQHFIENLHEHLSWLKGFPYCDGDAGPCD